jgi:hypothetical protein
MDALVINLCILSCITYPSEDYDFALEAGVLGWMEL